MSGCMTAKTLRRSMSISTSSFGRTRRRFQVRSRPDRAERRTTWSRAAAHQRVEAGRSMISFGSVFAGQSAWSTAVWEGAPGESRTHTGRVLNPLPLPVGLRGRARGETLRDRPWGGLQGSCRRSRVLSVTGAYRCSCWLWRTSSWRRPGCCHPVNVVLITARVRSSAALRRYAEGSDRSIQEDPGDRSGCRGPVRRGRAT